MVNSRASWAKVKRKNECDFEPQGGGETPTTTRLSTMGSWRPLLRIRERLTTVWCIHHCISLTEDRKRRRCFYFFGCFVSCVTKNETEGRRRQQNVKREYHELKTMSKNMSVSQLFYLMTYDVRTPKGIWNLSFRSQFRSDNDSSNSNSGNSTTTDSLL